MSSLIKYIGLFPLNTNLPAFRIAKPSLLKSLVFYLFSGTTFATILSGDIVNSLLETSLNMTILVIIILGLIIVEKEWSSFNQLLTTVVICENLFLVLDIGAEGMEYFLEATSYDHYVSILGLILFICNFIFITYILKNAFNFNLIKTLVLGLLYFSATDGVPLMLLG